MKPCCIWVCPEVRHPLLVSKHPVETLNVLEVAFYPSLLLHPVGKARCREAERVGRQESQQENRKI